MDTPCLRGAESRTRQPETRLPASALLGSIHSQKQDREGKPFLAAKKRQHYVQQSYLDRFTDDNGQVWAYSKTDAKRFRTRPGNVAAETYFYDLPGDEQPLEDRQIFENTSSPLVLHWETTQRMSID